MATCQEPYTVPFAFSALSYSDAVELAADTGVLPGTTGPLLETVIDMLDELGRPDAHFDCIQIAGTNGKTSTTRFCAALLRAEGLRTALYTSPQLVRYEERMELDGSVVCPEAFSRGVSCAAEAGRRVNARRAARGLEAYTITPFDLLTVAAMVVFAILTVRPEATFFGLALVGVCAGFLRYNFHPASIFMGDSGSILLGMSLGVVSLFATTKSTLFVSLLMPIIVAGVPVIDTAAAIIRRKRQHQSVMQADRGHIHHRLLSEGYSQRSTVLIMWGWTAILSVSALFITEMHGLARLPFVCLALGVSAFFVIKLNLLGPVLQHHYNPRPSTGKKRINEQFNAASGNASSSSHTEENSDE